MRYRVKHSTTYEYTTTISQCYNEAKILPRSTVYQDCLDVEIIVLPNPNDMRERLDFFGNRSLYFAIQYPHKELTVSVESYADVHPGAFNSALKFKDGWEAAIAKLNTFNHQNDVEAFQFTLESSHILLSRALQDYAYKSFYKNRPLISAVLDLNQRIFTEFAFDPEFTTISTPIAEVLKHKKGVCQDFAHLAIGCIRSIGLAAKYVSGYIETKPPPGKEKLIGTDASHAWFSVYVPEIGWVDFDPTNNQVPDGQHITVAWGRDYSDIPPLKGVIYGGGDHKLTVSVDVSKVENT